jgi:hypothetical protein
LPIIFAFVKPLDEKKNSIFLNFQNDYNNRRWGYKGFGSATWFATTIPQKNTITGIPDEL